MNRLPHDIDIHTHRGEVRADAVLCFDPVETDSLPTEGEGLVSVGIHPWNADKATDETFEQLERMLADPRAVAVGEAGLDRLRGPEMEVQIPVFERQIELARRLGLPLVIHCVRAFDILTALRKRHPDAGQWIVHGFRGKPELATRLLKAGIDLSYGEKFNAESYEVTPADRRYRETD